MSWRYYVVTHQLFAPNNTMLSAEMYSGDGAGKNNPAFAQMKNVGPIPAGKYSIGHPFDSPDHGPHCLPLLPIEGTDTHGRAGFLMHGDSVKAPGTASKGCIIAPRYVRDRVSESDDKVLEVV